ncbi:hypothetical protein AeMF1_008191 [Aphanomyces euteiches]|nr:hypothetical protein AeMF1_008191 [Aphanomyces euteiches]KAH9165199.1 hypothetical protein AeNC1_018560 [Aphanomyces euteiches]
MAANLFSPTKIGSVQLANRIIMAPLTRTRAGPSHVPNDLMKEYYAQRASAGLIITECSMIAPNTSAFVGEPGVYTDEQLKAWKGITDAVHDKGGKIFAQIWHAGRAAHPDNNGGVESVSSSAIAIEGETHTLLGKMAYAVPRALTVDEIKTIVQQFATAAKNSIEVAGFDGIEIHGANGYLIDQFLRSSANTRTDNYGGSLENRSRFLTEVLEAVTAAVGADKVGIRFSPLNSYNSMKDEDPIALSEHVAKIAQRFNLAYVHILRSDLLKAQEGDIEPIFRKHFHNTFISNAGYTKDEANAAIESGLVDAVAFGVPFIANPDLVERFKLNAGLNTPDPSTFYVPGAKGYTDYPALT